MSKKEAVTIMEIYFSLLWQESGLIIILIWAICCVHKIKNARHVARYEFPIGILYWINSPKPFEYFTWKFRNR